MSAISRSSPRDCAACRALKLSPSHPGALLERGYLRRAKGDAEGARARDHAAGDAEVGRQDT